MEDLEVKKKYQWITGPRTNGLEIYLAEDETSVWFESGRSVPKEQLDVALRLIDDNQYNSLMAAKSERERIQDLLGNSEPLTMSKITPDQIGNVAPAPQPEPIKEPVEPENPIALILKRQKKLDTVDIKMSMPVEIPPSNIYSFLTMMFDEEEVLDILTKDIVSKFSDEDIKTIVRNSIIKYYNTNE